ncbi:mechanosensitive ion channel family protein [Desulfovibrio oxyclinae]|uniref:mechanosensitive ion channel family protein n=1 Tax=Desulfovibrio oxyclinae TaxID=63560 RepID=UPI00036EC41C|nr:mechanosensitive ion channel domain-containing protein [Desulfovibrio oxyclinae]
MQYSASQLLEKAKAATAEIADRVLDWEAALQAGLVATSLALALVVWKPARRRLFAKAETVHGEWLAKIVRTFARSGWLLPFMLLCRLCQESLGMFDRPAMLVGVFTNLSAAWLAAQLLRSVIASRFWGRALAYAAWGVAALHILGLLEPAAAFLDGLGLSFGETRLSALVLLKGVLLGVLLLQAASVTSRIMEQQISGSTLSPSLQVLFGKALRIGLYAGVGLVVISSMGISMTSLAVFSGAVGVGIGFGLQKIFSNLVSGVILLLDRSIKPGDTIEVQGAYGFIRSLHARYASVLTRDGKEYLIPNEHLITNQVINWTFSDNQVRLRLPVGISYESDVRLALDLMLQAARQSPRVVTDPAPNALLVGFGDSSVDLELRVWIADTDQGIGGVRHTVLLGIWDLFHEHGIQIPFPQRDVLLKQDSSLRVSVDRGETESESPGGKKPDI